MVLSAPEALILTNNTIQIQSQQRIDEEVDLAERQIRNSITRNQFSILYNARKIGNPITNPITSTELTPEQISFRDIFINAGYFVSLDNRTGYWLISWENTGIEQFVNVYHVYTTVTPGPVLNQTINVINNYLQMITPISRAKTTLVNPPSSGGNINEGAFGATLSTFYTYVIITQQSDKNADYSSGILSALISSGLGYNNTIPDNVEVYKIA